MGIKFVDMLAMTVSICKTPPKLHEKLASLSAMHISRGVEASMMAPMGRVLFKVLETGIGSELFSTKVTQLLDPKTLLFSCLYGNAGPLTAPTTMAPFADSECVEVAVGMAHDVDAADSQRRRGAVFGNQALRLGTMHECFPSLTASEGADLSSCPPPSRSSSRRAGTL